MEEFQATLKPRYIKEYKWNVLEFYAETFEIKLYINVLYKNQSKDSFLFAMIQRKFIWTDIKKIEAIANELFD